MIRPENPSIVPISTRQNIVFEDKDKKGSLKSSKR